jgi:acetoacetyl-CoA reductase
VTRTALVTGAAHGLGATIAGHLAAGGSEVHLVDRDPVVHDVAGRLHADGSAAYGHVVDLIDESALLALTAQLPPVDVLVNNAGITKDGFFHKMTPDQWYGVINTNLNSLFNMTRPVWEGMRTRKFGRVICISSINGQKGQAGQVNYSAAKAGDLGFVKALALEGARVGITVNAICPGYIATDMVKAIPQEVLAKNILPQIPVGRLGEPEEIGRAVVFLASDDAGFITGSTISANGGQHIA